MMWGIVALILVLGSVGGMAQSSVMGRLSWCSTLCMCETQTNTEVQCFEEDDVYQLLGFSRRSVARLRKTNWKLEDEVNWCTDLCLCNIETGKEFRCTEPHQLTQLIINKIGDTYFLEPEEKSEIKQEAERSVDEDEDPSLEHMSENKRNKKNKKNRKSKKHRKPKHKVHSDEPEPEPEVEPEPEAEPEPEPEPELAPERDVYHMPMTLTPTPAADMLTSTPTHHNEYRYVEDEIEEFEIGEEHEVLPKHEAVAASPAVTARQSPTRKIPPYSTAESQTPLAAEGLSPRVQPILEVPKEKKTVASMVSQDLDDLGSTVRNIKNDVMLNQRILLVTVAIAGVAMLGVLILAVLSCTNRRHNQAANATKRDATKDGHSPKMNLEEAW